jgi:hypothetical protein
MEHTIVRLTGGVAGFGKFENINKFFASHDNKGVAFEIFSSTSGDKYFWDKRLLIYNDQVLNIKGDGGGDKIFALSFDGQEMALVHKEKYSKDEYFNILINGFLAYKTDILNMWNMFWLPNGDLVWQGHTGEGVHTYINGRDVTGLIEFRAFCDIDRNELGIIVKNFKDQEECAISKDGSVVGRKPLTNLSDTDHDKWREYWEKQLGRKTPERDNLPEYLERGKKSSLKYLDVTGPPFDDIGATRGRVFSEDLSKVGYIGSNLSMLGKVLSFTSETLYDWSKGASDYIKEYFGRFGQAVTSPLDWFNLKLLCNAPCLNNCTPCVNDKPWSKSYWRAEGSLFTPSDKFVAVVWPRRSKCCVSIDGDDGPLFDHIKNVRYNRSEKELSYIGIRGDTAFRGSVICS